MGIVFVQCDRAQASLSSVLILIMECAHDSLGILLDDSKQGLCRSFWFTATLLPVLEGLDAHTDHPGELRLGEPDASLDAIAPLMDDENPYVAISAASAVIEILARQPVAAAS